MLALAISQRFTILVAASFSFNSSPMPGRDRSGDMTAVDWLAKAVEEHALDARVVVKELHVHGARDGAADMQMHARAAVRREGNIGSPT